MAPMFTTSASPQKRPLSAVDNEARPSKKQRQFYHRHHTLQFKQQGLPGAEPALFAQKPLLEDARGAHSETVSKPVGSSQIDEFLDHSITSICKDVAARDGITDCSIEGWALETFKGCVEEYVLNLCKYVRRSTLAARRTAPIITDLESAFQAVQVPTPEDQLPPRLMPRPPSPLSLLPTPPPDEFFTTHELPATTSGLDLNATEEKTTDRYVPSTFPAFPSRHTFRATPMLPPRERDPRRVRELATEEGRLGEQALRKLAGAGRGEGKLDLSVEADDAAPDVQRGRGRQKVESMERMLEETMKELVKAEKESEFGDYAANADFEMAPIVNSERKFWMPDTSRRRPPRNDLFHPGAKAGPHHHAVSEKARGKQKVSGMLDRSTDTGLDLDVP